MGSQERRVREKEELRSRILDAARDLFVKEGFESVSMRKIADAIEYSPTAIYTLFKDKEDLMRELCSNDFAHLAQLFARLAKIKDPVDRIRQTGREYIKFAIANPNHYRLMFMTIHTVDPTEAEMNEKCGNPDQDGYAFLKVAVEEAIAQKRFRKDLANADLVTQILWAGVHGVASLQITHGKDPWLKWTPIQHRIDLMTDGLIRGLLAKPEKA